MNKLLSVILIIILSIILGGLYGIIHDQITYTISSEYFTKLKFYQFGLTQMEPELVSNMPRVCAGIVGFLATWWFGLILGAFLAIVGLRVPTSHYFKLVFRSILMAIGIAAIAGCIGFLYGYFFLDRIPAHWHFHEDLSNKKGFIITACIHNASYTGGVLGTILGMVFLLYKRKKLR